MVDKLRGRKHLSLAILLGIVLLLGVFIFSAKAKVWAKQGIKSQEILEDKFYVPKVNLQSGQILTYEEKNYLTNKDKEYLSRIIYPELKIYVLGFRWQGEENSDNDIQVQVRFLNKDGSFTEWFDVDKSFNEFGKGNNISIQTSEPVIAPQSIGFQYKVKLKKDSPSLLDNLNFICIDSSRSKVGKAEKKLFNQAEAAEITGINIISRAGWGCGAPNNTWEELRSYARNVIYTDRNKYSDEWVDNQINNIHWAPEYVQWKKVVIHHTAGDNYIPDPAGTVRGIWQYHTYTLGWGDIGYNFLVSPDGQVFEGRFGGKNVVGGHARPYNYGTIGISVLGTYTNVGISNAAFNSLTDLIAQKAAESGFEPAGTSDFTNSYGQTWYNMPNIVGHRDCAPTECPGQAFYNQLPAVRSTSQSKYNQYTSYKLYKTSSSPTVYLIDVSQNKKFPIPSLEMFNSWGFSWDRVETVSESLLNNIPAGPTVTNLAKAGLTIYLIDNGQKKGIPTPAIFNSWGFVQEKVVYYSNDLINLIPTGPTVTNLAKGSSAAAYLVENGQKRWIPNPTIFSSWNFSWVNVRTYSDDLINSLPSGPTVTNLAKGSLSTVYIIDQQKKKPIPDMTTFNAWELKTADIRTYSDDLINSITSGSTVNRLAKGSAAIVYIVDQGKKKPIPDMTTFNAWGFKTTDIRTYSDDLINSLSLGSIVTNLAKGSSPTVYLIENGKKNPFPDAQTFEAWGYSWGNIRTYSDDLINSLPSGAVITRLIKGSTATVYYLEPIKTKRPIPNVDVFYSYRFNFNDVKTISDTLLNPFSTGPILPPNTTPIKVTAAGKFGVDSSSLGRITTSGAGKIFEVRYLAGQYYVNDANNCWMSSGYIRFVPLDNQAIMEITSYYDPNWNGSTNYNRFLGVIEARYSNTSNALWAINELALEDYLKGIGEASNNNPSEYLKTMAVAERSYAYWHIQRGGKHQGEPFHLKNSRRGNGNDQVYCGYGFQVLAPNVTAAVNATRGQVVSGHGYNVCITPYSHGAKGSTRPGSAIGLDYPWLQSEADPYGDPNAGLNNPSGNHLVGLSASGALGYVNNERKSYPWILNHYYRGTGLSTLPDPGIRIAIYKIQY